tara:strand:- start:2179 stop:2409 length:231 start_codon:yes stop_codon:yes gene_type:complete
LISLKSKGFKFLPVKIHPVAGTSRCGSKPITNFERMFNIGAKTEAMHFEIRTITISNSLITPEAAVPTGSGSGSRY